jgi:glycosyltransferase involved in cell wall biosynthesis
VSAAAAAEFRAYASALPAQGLAPPHIFECRLAEELAPPDAHTGPQAHPDRDTPRPLVLCVGLEPRKNPLGLLYAAERLWREQLDFELCFVAGSGWGDEALRRIDELARQGRPISIATALSERELAAAYRRARFTVFASLHEGYGLPVAESLACGTPVITTGYGSTKEVASGGGALLVDPRDDNSICDAMRRLLTDNVLLATLEQEIAARPVRTWEQYAAELWGSLVTPELEVATPPRVDRPTAGSTNPTNQCTGS